MSPLRARDPGSWSLLEGDLSLCADQYVRRLDPIFSLFQERGHLGLFAFRSCCLPPHRLFPSVPVTLLNWMGMGGTKALLATDVLQTTTMDRSVSSTHDEQTPPPFTGHSVRDAMIAAYSLFSQAMYGADAKSILSHPVGCSSPGPPSDTWQPPTALYLTQRAP